MFKTFFLIVSLLISIQLFGQDKVTWSYSFNKSTSSLEINAKIAEGWHLYSQHIDNEIGPVPTLFEFEKNKNVKFVGSTSEPESLKEYDENFEGELNFFKDKVTFVQKIEVQNSTTVNGIVTFMVCNETMCLPPTDIKFSINVQK